jgi:UDP-N-acetylglucosamine 4,6-dehydratase/5-epimerase
MTPINVASPERLTGRIVLITGGTGSFGTAMARRLLTPRPGTPGSPAEVRILSRDEAKQHDMRHSFADDRLRCYLGDVRDSDSIARACGDVDYVFHAAALKQVPSCEFFPLEAVRTNIMGSANVMEAARRCGVKTVVCLSTDKAVYPVNAMGMSKALMEKVVEAASRESRSTVGLNGEQRGTVMCTVRYGNVLYSRGSVVPLFVSQLRSGVPLTITDPRMTRFLMSLDEAVLLVEHAFSSGRTGDLFVRKAPASTIQTLANAVASVFGCDPATKVLGTRHGEKLYETLLSREEAARAEDRGDYYRVPTDPRGLNYESYFDEGDERVASVDEYTSHNTQRLETAEVRQMLLELPEIQAELRTAGGRHGLMW